MDDVNGGGASQMPDQGGFDQTIDTILNPSAPADQGTGKAGAGGLTGGTPEANSQFQFAGRQWKDQTAAEKAYNKLYGQQSDTNGTLNMIKKILSNPDALQAAQQDPRWAPILEKLGLQAAEEEIEAEDAQSQGQEVTPQQALQEMRTFRATLGIEREEMAYEKKLGRALSDDEHNATMRMIARSPSLSFEEAYFVAHRDKVMREAAQKAAQNAAPRNSQGRPKPLPRGIPGTSYDLKKPVEQMGADEYREYLRTQPEFQALLNRE